MAGSVSTRIQGLRGGEVKTLRIGWVSDASGNANAGNGKRGTVVVHYT